MSGCGKKKPKRQHILFDAPTFYGKQKAAAQDGKQAGALAGGPRRTAPPMSLTCSDGTGLRLETLTAHAVIEGPLAFTELHLAFRNPEQRQREGRFAITLPPGAAISRFAMLTNDKWMEGEVVEKQKARRIYEDHLHRKQDPALLEADAGNTFRARVFPIRGGELKHLIVSYTTTLEHPEALYRLPLAGLARLDQLTATVAVHHKPKKETRPRKPHVVDISQAGFEPRMDLIIDPFAAQGPEALRNGDLVALRVPLPGSGKKVGFGTTLILFDTSASEAVDFEGRVDRLGELIAFVGRHGAKKVTVLAFDQTVQEIFADAPARWGKEQRDKLIERGALGASDWAGALGAAADALQGAKDARVIAFGNGVATAGYRQVDKLREAALALGGVGVVRLDTVEMAAQRDMAVLRAIATAGLDKDGTHVQLGGRPGPGAKADFGKLLAATFGPIRVAVKGSSWVWPREIRGAVGGGAAVVYAQTDAAKVEVELSGGVQAKMSIEPDRTSRALLHSAWVGARIQRLLHDAEFGDPDMRPMARKQALKLSIKHRVLCELTGLLVLESDADYRRYGLDQTAPSDILAVSRTLEVASLDRKEAYELRRYGMQGASPSASAEEQDKKVAAPRKERRPAGLLDRIGRTFGDESEDGDDMAADSAPAAPAPDTPSAAPEPEKALRRVANRGFAPPPPKQAVRSKPRAARAPRRKSESRVLGSGGIGSGRIRGLGGPRPKSAAGARVHDDFLLRPGAIVERKRRVQVTAGPLKGSSSDRGAVAKTIRRRQRAFSFCYERSLRRDPRLRGTARIRFTLLSNGRVHKAVVEGLNAEMRACVSHNIKRMRFPSSDADRRAYSIVYRFEQRGGSSYRPPPSVDRDAARKTAAERRRLARERARLRSQRLALQRQRAALAEEQRRLQEQRQAEDRKKRGRVELAELRAGIANSPNIKGSYAKIRHALDSRKLKTALREALRWRREDVGNAMALVALGDTYSAMEESVQAARAYGSLIDLFPSRADLRRFAGNLLEGQGDDGRSLAIDTYKAAVEQRPDHPAGYHMLAMALATTGELGDAIAVLEKGLSARRRRGNFRGVDQLLRDDLAMVRQARTGGGGIPPNLRFVLTWETDANDVDFHIFDGSFEHASFRRTTLSSGGRLFADITTGYGPECFRIDNPTAYPYRLLAHYFAMGPMGYGMGRLQVLRFDGKKGFGVASRPFVIMQDRAYVDLGEVTPKTAPILR